MFGLKGEIENFFSQHLVNFFKTLQPPITLQTTNNSDNFNPSVAENSSPVQEMMDRPQPIVSTFPANCPESLYCMEWQRIDGVRPKKLTSNTKIQTAVLPSKFVYGTRLHPYPCIKKEFADKVTIYLFDKAGKKDLSEYLESKEPIEKDGYYSFHQTKIKRDRRITSFQGRKNLKKPLLYRLIIILEKGNQISKTTSHPFEITSRPDSPPKTSSQPAPSFEIPNQPAPAFEIINQLTTRKKGRFFNPPNEIEGNVEKHLSLSLENLSISNNQNDNAVFIAAKDGDVEALEELVKKGNRMDVKDGKLETPLFLACRESNKETVIFILNNGVDPNVTNNKGQTALHICASEGYVEIMDPLISSGSRVDHRDDKGNTPLHLASMKGQLEAVELLLSRFADSRKVNNEGKTCLHLAAQEGHLDVVKAFSSRVQPNAEDKNRKTPLNYAKFMSIIEYLVSEGERRKNSIEEEGEINQWKRKLGWNEARCISYLNSLKRFKGNIILNDETKIEGSLEKGVYILNDEYVFKQVNEERLKQLCDHNFLSGENVLEIIDIKFSPMGLVLPRAEMNLYQFIKTVKKGNRIQFCQNIAKAMVSLYQQKPSVSHQSLTSKNILIFKKHGKYDVMVSDFGVAQPNNLRDVKDLEYLGIIPPERIPNQSNPISNFNEKCDVYSFSMIMWELYEWTTLDTVLPSTDLGSTDQNWRPSLPSAPHHQKFENLIKRCWDQDPEKRPEFQTILNELFRMSPMSGDQQI